MTALPLVAVVALAENDVIGRDNDLPWRIRTDLQRFKRLTMGRPLIVGRRNWDAIGRPLPGREMVVLTRDASFSPKGCHVAHDWAEAKACAADLAVSMGADAIVIGGGAEIYRLAMPELTRLHLTRVHARPEGDVVFPPFEAAEFREVWREAHPAGDHDEFAFTFIDLERRPGIGMPETSVAGR